MLVRIENINAEGIYKAFSQTLHTKYSKNGCEYQSDLPKKYGNLTLKSYNFNDGFNFNILQGDVPKTEK